MSSDKPAPLFGRQPCDTDESFAAFVEYRDQLAPRQLRTWKYGDAVREWYRDHGWKARVAAFDEWRDELRRQHYGDALKQPAQQIAAEHMGILQDMRDMLRREVDKWREQVVNNAGSPFLKMSELVKLTDVVVKYDRLVRGEATERKDEPGYDYSKLSPDELLTLQKLLVKTRKDD